MAYVEIQSITKSFDEKKVLNQVSFEIMKQSIKLKEFGPILVLLVYIVLVKMSLNILRWNIKLEFHIYMGIKLF